MGWTQLVQNSLPAWYKTYGAIYILTVLKRNGQNLVLHKIGRL